MEDPNYISLRIQVVYPHKTVTSDFPGPLAPRYVYPSEPMPAHEHDIHRDIPVGRHRQPQGSIRSTSAS